MQKTSRTMPIKIDYKIEKNATASVLHHCDQVRIRLEKLNQSSNPTRFYHAFEETFLFVLKGELFLKNNQHDMILKPFQGTLLPRDNTIIATLLQPNVEIYVITFLKSAPSPNDSYFKKVSSGTVAAQPSRLGMTIWPLWQGEAGMIAISLYPAGYQEPPYYQKTTQQFLLPLTGTLSAAVNKHPIENITQAGMLFAKRVTKAIVNQQQDSATALNVFAPFPEKGRILVLTPNK